MTAPDPATARGSASHAPAPGRAFVVASLVVLAAIVCTSFYVATQEWFSRDDFAFLTTAADEGRTWLDVFLPLDEGTWRFYRPLGFETYFRVCHALFGLEAFGFFAVLLVVHFAGGLLVWRLARQLGFAPAVAIATALLCVSRPSLSLLFYGSMFHYVALCFFSTLAVSLFLDATRHGRISAAVGSSAALALALLCNESAVMLPLVLVFVAAVADWRGPRAVLPILVRAIPHVAIGVAYLILRFGVLPSFEGQGDLYTLFVSGHAARNVLALLLQSIGGPFARAATALLVVCVLAAVLGRPAYRTSVGGALLRTCAVGLGWAVIASAPLVLLPFIHPRFGVVTAVPTSLLLGGLANALWCVSSERLRPALEAGMLALVLVSVPFAALFEVGAEPAGAFPRHLIGFVDANDLERGDSRLVVLYGADGLADEAQAKHARYLIYGGGIFRAVYRDSMMTVRFHDVRTPAPRGILTPRSVYVTLGTDLTLAFADAPLVERLKREREQ